MPCRRPRTTSRVEVPGDIHVRHRHVGARSRRARCRCSASAGSPDPSSSDALTAPRQYRTAATSSRPAITPSVSRKPCASSKSEPGVRIVTVTAVPLTPDLQRFLDDEGVGPGCVDRARRVRWLTRRRAVTRPMVVAPSPGGSRSPSTPAYSTWRRCDPAAPAGWSPGSRPRRCRPGSSRRRPGSPWRDVPRRRRRRPVNSETRSTRSPSVKSERLDVGGVDEHHAATALDAAVAIVEAVDGGVVLVVAAHASAGSAGPAAPAPTPAG